MNKKIFLIIILLFVFLTPIVFAGTSDKREAFHLVINLPKISLEKLTPVFIDLSRLNYTNYFVYDNDEKKFIPSKFTSSIPNIIYGIESSNNELNNLIDKNLNSSVFFEVKNTNIESSEVILNLNPDIYVDAIKFILSENSPMPDKISIFDVTNNKMILNSKSITSNLIKFIPIKTSQLAVIFHHIQPVSISEIYLFPNASKNSLSRKNKKILFLAKPNHNYSIYFNPAYNPQIYFDSEPNWNLIKKSKNLKFDLDINNNSLFKDKDNDGDKVPNNKDNCVDQYNPNQLDKDHNGKGDACEDDDFDGILNARDNCPNEPNVSQADIDKDGIGDACDTQESRFTEKYKFLLWVAIVFVFISFGIISYFVLKKQEKK